MNNLKILITFFIGLPLLYLLYVAGTSITWAGLGVLIHTIALTATSIMPTF